MSDIAHWLRDHGLDKYVEAFTQAEIDVSVLRHLTDADLAHLGLPLGPRRKVLAAIESLRKEPARDFSPTATASHAEAERRQLTVMFADLVNSTAMAHALDPEELRTVIRHYQDVASAAIARYEGHVAKFMGDGVLAYFGWPRAHEDDAERAVRAGLALNAQLGVGERPLSVRIGIATGVVVVGDVVGQRGAKEEAAVGETLHLAARLQQAAPPGAIIVSASTRALLGGAFELEHLAPQPLKGIADLVESWRVLREGQVETRFEAARGGRLCDLVGREQELALALARWDLAKAGEGQVLLIRAESGIGKSRLAAELRARLEPQTVTVRSYQGSPHHASSAFYPVVQQIVRAAQIDDEEGAGSELTKLRRIADQSGVDPARAVPVLANLLSIPLDGEYRAVALSPQQQKTETYAVLLELLAGITPGRATMLLVEDLHWFDPTTRELLDRLVGRIEALPVLMIATFRPEIATPWEGRGHVTLITLDRLGRRQIETQILAMAQGRNLPAEAIEQIIARSDGVPLFVEELTKAAVELNANVGRSGQGGREPKPAPLSIPTSLRASLLARLDRLPASREIAHIGAVLGREFDFDVLAAVSTRTAEETAAALDELQRAEIMFPRGTPPRTRWTFKHALIQDAAYETMLKTSRVELHARIAQSIATRFPTLAESEPETVARHYEAAGNLSRAAEYWAAAGRRALARHAGIEAIQHLSKALDAMIGRSNPAVRLDLEISLGEAFGVAGRLSDAKAHLPSLVALARDRSAMPSMARAAIALAHAEFNSGTTQRSTIALLEEALDRLSNDESLRLRAMNELSRGLSALGEPARAWAIADEIARRARVLDDQRVLAEALELRFFMPMPLTPEQMDEYRSVGRELVAATRAVGSPGSIANVLTQQIYWSAQFGDVASLRSWLAQHDDHARSTRVDVHIAVGTQARAMEAILAGELNRAEKLSSEALALATHEHGGMAHGIHGIQMFTIRREQDRLAEVAGVFRRFVDDAPEGSAWEPGFALLASDLGFEAPVRRILRKHAASGFVLPNDAMNTATLAFFAEAAVRLCDRDAGLQILGQLLPYQHMTVTVGFTVVCYGATARFLGLLADLLDDRTTAQVQFERALAMNERMEAWLWLAHTQADFAAVLRRWGSASDLARADELAGAARETAQRLDLAFVRRKLATLLH